MIKSRFIIIIMIKRDWKKEFEQVYKEFDNGQYYHSKMTQLRSYLEKQGLSTPDEILEAFRLAARNGYVGFHFAPIDIPQNVIRDYLNAVFDVSADDPARLGPYMFFVKKCRCDKMLYSVYTNPREVGIETCVSYEYNGTGYVDWCFDV